MPKNHFTVGINDDVTSLQLAVDPSFSTSSSPAPCACLFYGLGADGTVGANKNSIKIIGEGTDLYAQGYFVYDSKKSGSVTVSHLRFGPQPDPRAVSDRARRSFIACHQFGFLERFDMLDAAARARTFLLNSPFAADEVWDHLPRQVQARSSRKQLRFYVIDGNTVAPRRGHGRPREHDHADLLLCAVRACCRAMRPSARSSTRSRRRTANAAKRSSSSNFAAVDRGAGASARGTGAGAAYPAAMRAAPAVPRRGAGVRATCDGADDRRAR